MMKKKYIKPEMKVYEVGTQQLLAGSDTESFLLGGSPSDGNGGMY